MIALTGRILDPTQRSRSSSHRTAVAAPRVNRFEPLSRDSRPWDDGAWPPNDIKSGDNRGKADGGRRRAMRRIAFRHARALPIRVKRDCQVDSTFRTQTCFRAAVRLYCWIYI